MKKINSRTSLEFQGGCWSIFEPIDIRINGECFEVAVLRNKSLVTYILKNPSAEDGYFMVQSIESGCTLSEIEAIIKTSIESKGVEDSWFLSLVKNQSKDSETIYFVSDQEPSEDEGENMKQVQCYVFDNIEDLEAFNKCE